jgi:tetratricopeptide (TPR) repeat protein
MPTDLNLLAAEGYFELEMFEDALDELETADQLPENRMEVLTMQLSIFLAQKRWKDSLPLGEALCDLDPDEPQYFIQYAYALRELDRFEDARCVLLDGPEELEQSSLFYYNLACYEALLGETTTALSTLQHAFAIDPDLKSTALADPDLKSIHDNLPPPEGPEEPAG